MSSPTGRWRILRRSKLENPAISEARREAIVAAIVAAAATAYSLGYCTRFGYDRIVEPVQFVLGFPSWVFWGVVVPWGVCVLICGWFSTRFMNDSELGEACEDVEDA